MSFDNIEYISIENQTTSYPKHFHAPFCISLIHIGVERIDFEDQTLFTEAGSISITNPYEIHSNPLIDDDSILKFDTIYIPNDVMKSLMGGQNIKFVARQITNKKANSLFIKLKDVLATKNNKLIERYLLKFIEILKAQSETYQKEYLALNSEELGLINDFIEANIREKIDLDDLSNMTSSNKSTFSKKFERATGMIPMNYIWMKKIFSSKKMISYDSELTSIAHAYNFRDLAHFSKIFKRFIGISPQQYQTHIDIETN